MATQSAPIGNLAEAIAEITWTDKAQKRVETRMTMACKWPCPMHVHARCGLFAEAGKPMLYTNGYHSTMSSASVTSAAHNTAYLTETLKAYATSNTSTTLRSSKAS